MVQIAIVDNDITCATALRQKTESFFFDRGAECRIMMYCDSRKFLDDCGKYDLALIDGIETARLLRERDREILLVLVTASEQYAISGYELDALDFVLKPLRPAIVDRALGKALKRIKKRDETSIALKTEDGIAIVPIKGIFFVEVYDHVLIYHTEQGDFRVRGQFGYAQQQLSDSTFRICSRSCLVNLRHVCAVYPDHVEVHGIKIVLSRAKRKDFAQAYRDYLQESQMGESNVPNCCGGR